MAPSKKAPKGKPESYRTVIRVKFNCGFPNNVYIRGNDSSLSWSKGHLMINCLPDEWVWGTNDKISLMEFKILLNDIKYESGDNHLIGYGEEVSYIPRFD